MTPGLISSTDECRASFKTHYLWLQTLTPSPKSKHTWLLSLTTLAHSHCCSHAVHQHVGAELVYTSWREQKKTNNTYLGYSLFSWLDDVVISLSTRGPVLKQSTSSSSINWSTADWNSDLRVQGASEKERHLLWESVRIPPDKHPCVQSNQSEISYIIATILTINFRLM